MIDPLEGMVAAMGARYMRLSSTEPKKWRKFYSPPKQDVIYREMTNAEADAILCGPGHYREILPHTKPVITL